MMLAARGGEGQLGFVTLKLGTPKYVRRYMRRVIPVVLPT